MSTVGNGSPAAFSTMPSPVRSIQPAEAISSRARETSNGNPVGETYPSIDPRGTIVVATRSFKRVTEVVNRTLSTASANARRTRAFANGFGWPFESRGRQLKLQKSVPNALNTCTSRRSPIAGSGAGNAASASSTLAPASIRKSYSSR